MCRTVKPEAHLCEASATTQMSTPNLLLSIHGVSLCSQASLGLSILLPQAPNQQQAQASTSISAHSLLSLLEPRVDPGSLRRLTKCLSSECEGAVQRMVRGEVPLLFSALETEHRAPESSVLTVMPPSVAGSLPPPQRVTLQLQRSLMPLKPGD